MPPRPASAAERSDDSSAGAWPAGWIWAAFFLVVFAAYVPALSGGMLWDDHGHVTRADLRSFGGLFRIWFEVGATQQYYPLLHSAFWLEHRLWGDATLGYHVVNVLLHATAACLFGRLLRRLAVPGAWLAALLFALHPVCVESVAWISEQKNTLSAVFYLAAALAWLRFEADRSPRSYAAATAWFVLALLTKTVTATLPAALLVLAWWQQGRLEWRREVRPLLPWFVLAIAAGLFTAHFERELIGAQGNDFSLGLLERGLLAGRVFWFYLGKLAWPADLTLIYSRWVIDPAVWWQWLFPASAFALLVALWALRRRSRAPLAAMLLFAGTLFPVLGFVNVYPFLFSYVADHFQYLASLAVFALAAAGLARLTQRWLSANRFVGAAFLAGTLASLTWSQAATYRNEIALYETTLQRNPHAWMAHNNLAIALTQTGRPAEAVPHLEEALRLRPDYPEALNNLGDDLVALGRPAEAMPHLQRALQLQPGYAMAHNNLGNAFIAIGRPAEALAAFERAVQLEPGFALAESNRGLALAMLDRTSEALGHFEQALRLDPACVSAERNWAIGLTLTDRFAEAVPHYEKAIALAPDDPENANVYGRALARNGRPTDALHQFEQAIALNPNYGEAHFNAALALRQLGRQQEAGEQYAEAVRLNPRFRR